jgi:hypothetical protein
MAAVPAMSQWMLMVLAQLQLQLLPPWRGPQNRHLLLLLLFLVAAAAGVVMPRPV